MNFLVIAKTVRGAPLKTLLLITVTSACIADEQLLTWQPARGQILQAEVRTDYVTIIDVADTSRQKTGSDRMLLQYRIVGPSDEGPLHAEVRILALKRTWSTNKGTSGTKSLAPEESLGNTVVALQLGPGGAVTAVGHEKLLSFNSPEISVALGGFPDSVGIASWLDLPFWVPFVVRVPAETEKKSDREFDSENTGEDFQQASEKDVASSDDGPSADRNDSLSWNRSVKLSLGLLGAVRGTSRCEATDQDSETLKFSISGRLVHVPPAAKPGPPVQIDEIQLTEAELNGSGSIRIAGETGLPAAIVIQQRLKIQGSAIVHSAGKDSPLHFTRTMTRTCRSTGVPSHLPPTGF